MQLETLNDDELSRLEDDDDEEDDADVEPFTL